MAVDAEEAVGRDKDFAVTATEGVVWKSRRLEGIIG
jgi:hypothetical protein